MPVEFLTDDEAAAYGQYAEDLSKADPERVLLPDDEDMDLVRQHRGDHMKLGSFFSDRRARRRADDCTLPRQGADHEPEPGRRRWFPRAENT